MKYLNNLKTYLQKRPLISIFLMLVFLNLAIYWKVLGMFFISDDFDWLNLTQNMQNGWSGILTGNYYGVHGAGGTFRPMINVIFSLEKFIFGLNPFGYHAVQLLIHVGVAFLIYLILVKVLEAQKNGRRIAFLSAAIFSIMPNHVEAVAWIAAVGDPLATLFYLASFYAYLNWRTLNVELGTKNNGLSNKYFVLSLILFILALLTKEIAITLPFVILAYEIVLQKTYVLKSLVLRLSPYFLVLSSYLIYRYWAIGLLFGYYGRSSLSQVLHIKQYARTLIDLFFSMIAVGEMRITLSNFFAHYWYMFALVIVFLISYLYMLLKEQRRLFVFLSIFWLLNIILILPLSLGIINDEGQRYGYLPSITVAIFIVWMIIALYNYSEKIARVAVILIVCYFVLFQQMLVNQWGIASVFSQRIYNQISTFDFESVEKTYILGLPDSYLNAQLYRNGIIQSLELQGITFDSNKAERVPIYVHLDSQNRDSKLYGIITEEKDGFLWTTKDNQYIVTGNAKETHPDYNFELWGYNYANATADHIRMYFTGDVWQKILAGKSQVLYFDESEIKKY